jgi:lipopolysaccharide transport system ATP-binding protein
MSKIAIDVADLSKAYDLGTISSGTLSRDLSSAWARFRGKDDPNSRITADNDLNTVNGVGRVWALRDINLKVNQGEVLGIIGKNGAGKSTLLKILSRITSPTNGNAKIRGRIASLLEIGTGFHPELTGRENIYLNGAIMGMTRKEISTKLDAIIDFSGIEKYIDTPVKRYSSGMGVRLGFSVAAHLDPEILLIDEVLAVGDAEFQKKCLGKIENIASKGRTVLFVSHLMTAIRSLCNRAILLDKGKLIFDGKVDDTVNHYTSKTLENFTLSKNFTITQNNISLIKIAISKKEIISGEGFRLEFSFEKKDNSDYMSDISFHLVDEFGHLVFTGSTGKSNASFYKGSGLICAICKIPNNLMNEGTYTISRLLFVKDRGTVLYEIQNGFSFRILPKKQELGWMGEREEGILDPKLAWKIQIN